MKIDIYILLAQNFINFKNVEHAVAVGHENISLFPTKESALGAKNEAAEMLKVKNYHVTDSGTGNGDPFICYQSRYENDQNRTVVFTIIRKTVEGGFFLY